MNIPVKTIAQISKKIDAFFKLYEVSNLASYQVYITGDVNGKWVFNQPINGYMELVLPCYPHTKKIKKIENCKIAITVY